MYSYNYNNALSGQELIIDACECQGILNNKEMIEKFIDELCEFCNMKKVGDMVAEYFPYTEYNIERDLCGYTIVQVISVSSITIHIAEISKTVYFNFHTCNYLDENKVEELFKSYFQPTSLRRRSINRDINF
jgi:S-adenosylmethionine/arginine decarboxylase-like enzyme